MKPEISPGPKRKISDGAGDWLSSLQHEYQGNPLRPDLGRAGYATIASCQRGGAPGTYL